MTSPADLFVLQDIDLKRDNRRALVADIDARLGETEELLDARQALADAEAEVDRLRRDQRVLEAQLEDLDAKIRPLERKLYDGSIRNPRELTDLERDVNSLKARRGRLDDEGLVLLDSVETATAALLEKRQAGQSAESEWQASQQDLQAEREQADQESGVLQRERERWTSGMDNDALQLYESLRQQRQGRAVARIERGGCQGCRISLPTHVVQRVRTGTALVQCPSCERILVGA